MGFIGQIFILIPPLIFGMSAYPLIEQCPSELRLGQIAVALGSLGLTTQVPMRAVFLTSGRSRRLKLGAQTVEFRHAPPWQLIFPGRVAGDVVRALAWLGLEKAGEAIRKLRTQLPPSELEEVAAARARLPTWMAQEVSALMPRG